MNEFGTDYNVKIVDELGVETVLYAPEPHQAKAHASQTPNLLCLGTRGTGKSLWLRWDAIIRCLLCPNFHALIVRRTMPELRRSHLVFIDYEMKVLGGVFLHTTFVAKFPNGSTITFAHCETPADVMNFLSSQYGFIGFDELSTFTLDQFLQISSACRAAETAPYKAVIRASSNPLGIGADWMYEWFVDKIVKLEEFPDYNPDEFEMQFSTLEDNPHLDRKQYAARLKNLPEHIRRAWLLGERVVEGAYFMDFRTKTDDGTPWHVIPDVPLFRGQNLFNCEWLKVYRAVDWGYYPDPAVCLWLVVLPNKRVIVFKERTWKQTRAEDVAKAILRESEGMNIAETFADPSMFLKGGVLKATGYSISELFEQQRVPLTPSINDRTLYGYAIHDHLNTLIDGEPQLQIVQGAGLHGCPNLIRTLPYIRTDPNDPRKIADGEDHWVIALAYFCIGQVPPSREPMRSSLPRWMQPKRHARVIHHVQC